MKSKTLWHFGGKEGGGYKFYDFTTSGLSFIFISFYVLTGCVNSYSSTAFRANIFQLDKSQINSVRQWH